MKLRTRITAAAVSMLLFLSQAFSIWNLTETRKMVLDNIAGSELNWLEANVRRFEEEYDRRRKLLQDDRGAIFWGIGQMRSLFGSRAVLYYQGREIANSTPYQFDLNASSSNLYRYTGDKLRKVEDETSGILKDTQLLYLESFQGKRLLISYREIGKSPFSVVQYRDITLVYEESRSLFWRGMGMAFLLSVIFTAALTVVVRRILRPFYQLQAAADVIAKGDYNERVGYSGRDEVGQVAASFNHMADKIQEHMRELADTNEKQRRLLGALSHELKTPMTGIQGYAELLQKVKLPEEKQAGALRYIEEECKRLSRLSVKLLQLVELSGEEEIEWREIPVRELFERAGRIVSQRLEEGKMDLRIQMGENGKEDPGKLASRRERSLIRMGENRKEDPGKPVLWRERGSLQMGENGKEDPGKKTPVIMGDEDLLLSFLVNLIDNAVKAGEPGKTVTLICSEKGIFVKDEGAGIPEEEIARVTEPFYMVDKSRSRALGGAGLGLALCAQIARLHGGKLSIESSPGSGSCIGLAFSGNEGEDQWDSRPYRGQDKPSVPENDGEGQDRPAFPENEGEGQDKPTFPRNGEEDQDNLSFPKNEKGDQGDIPRRAREEKP